MNKVILMGRLTKNPEIKYAGKDNDMAVARYTLAVNRRYKRDGEQEADFISCVTFGKSAEFAQKYLHKGMRIVIGGRIGTGNYKDRGEYSTGERILSGAICGTWHDCGSGSS